MTREVPIYGRVNSLFVVGSIDEIVLKDGALRIIDTKTRNSDTMPSEPQKRTTRFQLMAYKHLFEAAQGGRFTTEDFLASYGFSAESEITKEFQREVQDIGDEIEPRISLLADSAFALVRRLPPVSDELEVRYESQRSRKMIGTDAFRFETWRFKSDCDFLEGFWLGIRKGLPVGVANRWKCNYCEFKFVCQDRMGPLGNLPE